MADTTLQCSTNHRRDKLRAANVHANPKWNGIEHVEFDADDCLRTVRIYFLCGFPAGLETCGSTDKDSPLVNLQRCSAIRIVDDATGQRVSVCKVTREADDSATVAVETELCCNHAYTLSILRPQGFDPQYAEFHFVASACTTDVDPLPPSDCPPRQFDEPTINYLARDFASLRQLLLDRLAQIAPDWNERHIPDIGMTLLELFAYVGDYFSYHQDAVATEAYLNTARQRVSVRRHVRLVDYQLHEGCNARAFVYVKVNGEVSLNTRDAFFITEHPDLQLKELPVLSVNTLADLPPNSYQPFEVMMWPTDCTSLKCGDITNVVGLIACLVTGSHAVTKFLFERFSTGLQAALRDYAQRAVAPPDPVLVAGLAREINMIATQYPMWGRLDFSKVLSAERWRCCQARMERNCTAADNIQLIKESLPDYFSRAAATHITLSPAFNSIKFYAWNQQECCLPKGATAATLFDGCDQHPDRIPAVTRGSAPAPYQAAGACCGTSGAIGSAPVTLAAPRTAEHIAGGDPFADSGSATSTASLEANSGDRPYDADAEVCSNYVQQYQQEWNLKSLSPGDVLVLEEQIGPETHNAADADPRHRQVVRLTRVTFCVDAVTRARLVNIEWGPEDALRFPLCVCSIGPRGPGGTGCELRDDVSVARGNIILVDHGLGIEQPEWLGETFYSSPPPACGDDQFDIDLTGVLPRHPRAETFSPRLKESDLTYSPPLSPCVSAAAVLKPPAHEALPAIQVIGLPIAEEPADSFRPDDVAPPTLIEFDDLDLPVDLLIRAAQFSTAEMQRLESLLPPEVARYFQETQTVKNRASLQKMRSSLVLSGGAVHDAIPVGLTTVNDPHGTDYDKFRTALRAAVAWQPRMHLLDSDAEDQHFVIEIDNERRTRLRFGDNDLGRQPPDGISFYARYRRGNGVVGNVGADKIKHLVFRREAVGAIESVRNPLPAVGGIEPESLDHARVHAPHQFKKLRRAITPADYADITMRDFAEEVQRARATLNWMGTWYEVAVAIDPTSQVRDDQALVDRVQQHLERHRRIGHLVKVNLPTYVALHIEMTVCVRSSHLKAHVQRELLVRFSNREHPDGTKGFFHPDNFSFGDALYLSRVIQEAKKVPGVENLDITRFERRGAGAQGELDAGLIKFAALEIPRLDNDPLRPELGCIQLRMEGAR